uniref:Uncharacterized protein n=1 Tax=Coccolithus braarudii TaxID=221442 RepID=A0A7S0LEW4_9EUKA
MERTVVKSFGHAAGVVLEALARRDDPQEAATSASTTPVTAGDLVRAHQTLLQGARTWRRWAGGLPGGHTKAAQAAEELVAEFLEFSHHDAIAEAQAIGWAPGSPWNLSNLAPLSPELKSRCKPALATATFTSVCR